MKMNNAGIFSIIVPVYQNEENIQDTTDRLLTLQVHIKDMRLEIIFVNDGSTDGSWELLKKQQVLHKDNIVLINLTRNYGQTQAIREGVRYSKGDCVGIISADLQDPPELFLDMIGHWRQGAKLVLGERIAREEGLIHSFFSNMYWKLISRFAIPGFPKGGFDFCVLDRQVINELNRIGEKNTSIFPLIFWMGFEYRKIPYRRVRRSAGVSQWTLARRIQLTLDTFFNFTYLPVRLISFSGMIISVLAFLYSLFLITRRMIYGTTVEGWTTITALVSIFGGLILFSLGVIGEYLWRILDESRKRPAAIIDCMVDSTAGLKDSDDRPTEAGLP